MIRSTSDWHSASVPLHIAALSPPVDVDGSWDWCELVINTRCSSLRNSTISVDKSNIYTCTDTIRWHWLLTHWPTGAIGVQYTENHQGFGSKISFLDFWKVPENSNFHWKFRKQHKHTHTRLTTIFSGTTRGLSAGCWGLSAGYQPRPQVVDRGTTARYGGQLRYI